MVLCVFFITLQEMLFPYFHCCFFIVLECVYMAKNFIRESIGRIFVNEFICFCKCCIVRAFL